MPVMPAMAAPLDGFHPARGIPPGVANICIPDAIMFGAPLAIGKPIGNCMCWLSWNPRGVPVGTLLPRGKCPLLFASLLLGAMWAGSRTYVLTSSTSARTRSYHSLCLFSTCLRQKSTPLKSLVHSGTLQRYLLISSCLTNCEHVSKKSQK
jgi:hypothetical protein